MRVMCLLRLHRLKGHRGASVAAMASSFKQVALSATRTLSQRAPLASSRQSGALRLAGRRAASSQATQLDNTAPADAPQLVPTLEETIKDPQLAGLGYPQLPNISRQTRPALADWWDRQER